MFGVRPRNRREFDRVTNVAANDPEALKTQVDAFTAAKTAQIMERKTARLERRRESRALRGLTLSVILIAEAVTLIIDRNFVSIPWTGYVVVALAGIALGCLIGTLWGNAS